MLTKSTTVYKHNPSTHPHQPPNHQPSKHKSYKHQPFNHKPSDQQPISHQIVSPHQPSALNTSAIRSLAIQSSESQSPDSQSPAPYTPAIQSPGMFNDGKSIVYTAEISGKKVSTARSIISQYNKNVGLELTVAVLSIIENTVEENPQHSNKCARIFCEHNDHTYGFVEIENNTKECDFSTRFHQCRINNYSLHCLCFAFSAIRDTKPRKHDFFSYLRRNDAANVVIPTISRERRCSRCYTHDSRKVRVADWSNEHERDHFHKNISNSSVNKILFTKFLMQLFQNQKSLVQHGTH